MKSRRDEHSEATRGALLETGREFFERYGYQGTSMDGLSRAARVTRGAVYHHFRDKQALFDAIVVQMQNDVSSRIARQAKTEVDVWDRLLVGISTYLDACTDAAYRRIVIQEAPTVLGSKRSREIEEATTLALLKATFDALKRRGTIDVDDVDLLTRLVDAMVCEIALMLSDAKGQKKVQTSGLQMIARMLQAVRAA